jgi:hypothetical protein
VKEERARAEVVRYWMDKAHEAVKKEILLLKGAKNVRFEGHM